EYDLLASIGGKRASLERDRPQRRSAVRETAEQLDQPGAQRALPGLGIPTRRCRKPQPPRRVVVQAPRKGDWIEAAIVDAGLDTGQRADVRRLRRRLRAERGPGARGQAGGKHAKLAAGHSLHAILIWRSVTGRAAIER